MQGSLFFDCPEDALGAAVAAIGGVKRAAGLLWPALNGSAEARLRACLNAERPEKLSPEEILMLGELARDQGDHSIMTYFAQRLGYEIKPLSSGDAKKRARASRLKALLAEVARLTDDDS